MTARDSQPADRLRDAGAVSLLRQSRIGLEKESLRVDAGGHIAQTPHPAALGSPLVHPYITTDFSEALLEFVTPPFVEVQDTLRFLEQLHQYTYRHIGDELLWCASMPCMVGGDARVPIADYGSSNVGTMKKVYRRGLSYRYGRIMQTIAGIHFNFSLAPEIWPLLYPDADPGELRRRIDQAYFGCVRNFLRYGWLVPLLFGSSPAVCKSFLPNGGPGFEAFDAGTWFKPYATSLRMSDVGYRNSTQAGLRIDYSGVDGYVRTLGRAIETPHAPYQDIGVHVDGEDRQLNANLLQIENEFYSFIRPKQIARSGEKPTLALKRRGVLYVEMRALDLDPFEPLGVSSRAMCVIEALLTYCALSPSPPIDETERASIGAAQAAVAVSGRDPALEIEVQGVRRSVRDHAGILLDAIEPYCELLDQAGRERGFLESLTAQRDALAAPDQLPSARVLEAMRRDKTPFFRFAMQMSERHRDHFRALALPPDREQMLDQEAARSVEQQREIESSDSISFEEYLRRYFSQTLDAREEILG